MSITLEEAKALKPGDIVHDTKGHRWKVNGEVQTWKRAPGRVRVPLKHGLYAYDYLTEKTLHLLTLGEPPEKERK